jgi:tetratricopeptide (TPR) repeat protein
MAHQQQILRIAVTLGVTTLTVYGLYKLLSKSKEPVKNTDERKSESKEKNDVDEYPINLGTYCWKHQTAFNRCQIWCNRGWSWVHGFHRQEASDCFQQAIKIDPNCAMAYYGLALVNGPDYNFSAKSGFYDVASQSSGWPSLNVAVKALKTALRLTSSDWNGPPQHRALIEALTIRYEWPVTKSTKDKQVEYRDAMRLVAKKYPNDPEVQAIYAESIMCLSPWNLYDNQRTDPSPNAYGKECLVALNRGLTASPKHYWLCHLRVHYDEMGKVEDFDWFAANSLRDGLHEIGHLLHMPTHLDIRVGDYKKAMEWNQTAYEADLKLIQLIPKNLIIYTGYLIHNMEFCAWAAMYGGNYEAAINAVAGIERIVTKKALMASARSAQHLELYRATIIMVYIRFGKWEELINLPFFDDRKLFLSHTLFLHYGKGIAYGAVGDVKNAKLEQEHFNALRLTLKDDDRIKHNVHIVDMSNIAYHVLNAEINYRENQYDDCYNSLTTAVKLFDGLPYDEPHGWLMSPRHTLGALLTEQKRFDQALIVYQEDLKVFPRNPWSLNGVQLCYDGLEMNEKSSENISLLKKAMDFCDVQIGASCACALDDFNREKVTCRRQEPMEGVCCSTKSK